MGILILLVHVNLILGIFVYLFLEREENVRCDIFLAYRALLNINKPINNNNNNISSNDIMETSETKLVL